MITHLPGPHPTRSRATIHDGRVHAVSFVGNKVAECTSRAGRRSRTSTRR